MEPDALDGISLEVLRNRVLAICEEVIASLVRSGRSHMVRERRDCSASIYSRSGEMIIQAEHIPVHLGVMPYVVEEVTERYTDFDYGDVFVTNDPYSGANHLPDVVVVAPLFMGSEHVGFAACMSHHSDVGGISPRSMPATAKDIFQEGCRIPLVRIRGDLMESPLVGMFIANSRTPGDVEADLRAQFATLAVAQRRINEINALQGHESYLKAIEVMLDAAEAAARRQIAALSDGEWRGESVAEDGRHTYPISCRLQVTGSQILVDFSGSAGQTASPFNATASNTRACILAAFRSVLAPDLAPTGGLYRPVEIRVPEGTILNPIYPAAISAATQVSYHTYEALMRALAPLWPHQVVADSGGGGVFSWGGLNPRTGDLYAYGEAIGGGGGACYGVDGESAIMPPISNVRDTSVEALEMDLPVRVERYELIEGSGGRGRWNGGLGIRRHIRMLAPATWTVQLSMSKRAPQGLFEGENGQRTTCRIVTKAGESRDVGGFEMFELEAGDLVLIETAGGAGYGSPTDRLSVRE